MTYKDKGKAAAQDLKGQRHGCCQCPSSIKARLLPMTSEDKGKVLPKSSKDTVKAVANDHDHVQRGKAAAMIQKVKGKTTNLYLLEKLS